MTDSELQQHEDETAELCVSLADDSEQLLKAATRAGAEVAPMLTGDVINFALRILGFRRPNDIGGDTLRCVSSYGLSTDLERHEIWLREGSRGMFVFQERGTVAGWNLHALAQSFDASLFQNQTVARQVAFPLHAGFHWSLVVLDRDAREFRLYDSIQRAHDSRAYLLRSMLVAAGMLNEPWTIRRMSCAQQRMSWECGYSLIGCAAHEAGAYLPLRLSGTEVAADRESIALLAGFLLARSETGRKTEAYNRSRLQNYLSFE